MEYFHNVIIFAVWRPVQLLNMPNVAWLPITNQHLLPQVLFWPVSNSHVPHAPPARPLQEIRTPQVEWNYRYSNCMLNVQGSHIPWPLNWIRTKYFCTFSLFLLCFSLFSSTTSRALIQQCSVTPLKILWTDWNIGSTENALRFIKASLPYWNIFRFYFYYIGIIYLF